jgi:uncharacterized protein YozE (UPF0346 family)
MSSSGATFIEWLVRQAYRDDPVGDIARDMLDDPQWPRHGRILADFSVYLGSVGASELALQALQQAWDEWSAT